MKKLIVVSALALSLAGCANARQDRMAGGAVAGGLIGAAVGALIADVTRPGWCYYYTQSGRRRYVRC